jgi:hypothetical protein
MTKYLSNNIVQEDRNSLFGNLQLVYSYKIEYAAYIDILTICDI